jgi:hypothetical protein
MGEHLVSLRAAATELGVPRTTLTRLVAAEPSLAAAVRGPGPRGATLVDMGILQPAWEALAGSGTEAGPSDRQRLRAAQTRRAWFDLMALQLELDQLEGQATQADRLTTVHDGSLAALRAAAAAWVDHVAEGLLTVEPEVAHAWIDGTVVDALLAVIAANDAPPDAPPAPREIRFPDDPPTLLALKAGIEHTRAEITRLKLCLQRGELRDVRTATDQFFVEGRQARDAWRRVGAHLAIRCRQLRTPQSVRSVALQELSAAGLV